MKRLRTPSIPFGYWIAILTLTGAVMWCLIFALAVAVGGLWLVAGVIVATMIAPFLLVALATRSWPQDAVYFCLCYSAVPLLSASASIFVFSTREWIGILFWMGAAILALAMAWFGAVSGRRSVRRQIELSLRRGECPKCGYDLRGGAADSATCPECGATR
jgi:hypothetical protein